MPKLQAACTMTAQDEMVLRTAQTSEKAAEGQNAVLEFILLNHPLDCPDCDKGGECPLQDLTFRWGPGKTRMAFPKRTFDKPIPISPDDHARPGALHPLLPLHALLGRRLRGWPARREEPRCQLPDRHLRGRAVPGALLRERDRALSGRRAPARHVSLQGAPLGDRQRPDRLRALPGRLQHVGHHSRGESASGCSRGTTRKWMTAGSATRAASPSAISGRATGSGSRCSGSAGAASTR